MTTVNNFLQDNFKSFDDLSRIDTLLADVCAKQDALQLQFVSSQKELLRFRSETLKQYEESLYRINELQDSKSRIYKLILSDADKHSSDDGLQTLYEQMNQLEVIELAKGYLQTLVEIMDLQESTSHSIQSDPGKALSSYNKLRDIVATLVWKNEQSEEAAVHLVAYAQSQLKQLWDSMQSILRGYGIGFLAANL